ncbi:MAG: DUF4138 domain-containing protein [Bacteroidota bacterium]
MKWRLILCVVMLGCVSLDAQPIRILGVSANRTTSVIFPSPIVSIDRGSERIVVQKSIPTILKVKAETVFSDTTSLTVVTADGNLYSFLVCYSANPENLSVNLSGAVAVDKDTLLVSLAKKVSLQKNNLYGIHASEGSVQLSLLGIYTTGELVLCKIRIENSSSLSYAVGGLTVYSKDEQQSKRRSTQERNIVPLLSFNQYAVVREKGLQVMVIILPKPSLNHSRKLTIGIAEKDGERNLSLSVSNRFVINALLLK